VISSILTLFTNLLVREAGVERNEIKDYLIKQYMPFLFSSIGLVLKRRENKFITLKKACIGFLSNLMVYPKTRIYIQKGIVSAFGKDNSRLMSLEQRDSNSSLFFIENLLMDCISMCQKSVEKHKKFGKSTAKYFDNVTSLLLNMTYKLDHKLTMAKMVHVLSEKKINGIFSKLVALILKYKSTLPQWEVLLKRCVQLYSKYYVPREPGKPIKPLTCLISQLLKFFKFNSSIEENKILTGEVTKLLVKILSSDKDSKPEIYELLVEEGKEQKFFQYLNEVVIAGPSEHIR
jgi:hypothetical protein